MFEHLTEIKNNSDFLSKICKILIIFMLSVFFICYLYLLFLFGSFIVEIFDSVSRFWLAISAIGVSLYLIIPAGVITIVCSLIIIEDNKDKSK